MVKEIGTVSCSPEHLNISLESLQSSFLRSKTLEERKKFAQYFTGATIADYMSSLFEAPLTDSVRILDAGAGSGMLAASASLYCLKSGCSSVHVVLYELDEDAIPYLEKSMNMVQIEFSNRGATFTYQICCEDFVLARPDKDEKIPPFDLSIINPPYFKYSVKDSPYAKAAVDLYHGDPNIYASFMAIVLASLKDGGQLVSITPRSFTNGLYFKGFRSYLLTKSTLNLIHIFKHRDKVFKNKETSVLQENIICHFIKGIQSDHITIRSSDCDIGIHDAIENRYPKKLIVDSSNDHLIIRIPESSEEAEILKYAETFSTTFEKVGYFISTGRVVEHRTRSYITNESNYLKSIPLYRPHNITPMNVTWDGTNKKDVSFMLQKGHEKHTMKNGTFVILKRFSSKDEKRRLVAGVHLANMHKCDLIGFGNKTNYIGLSEADLPEVEAYGLAAIFNSTFMDKYFRCISGNTQVNATEIRVMRFPSRQQVQQIGEQAKKLETFDTSSIDSIVNPILGLIDFS